MSYTPSLFSLLSPPASQLISNRRWATELTFQSNDLAGRIHNGGISGNGTTNGIGCVTEINDNDLSGLTDLLSDTDELVRLHREGAEADVCRIDADIL